MTVANQRERWAHMLRLLDAEVAGVSVGEEDAALLCEAQAMVHGGYLESCGSPPQNEPLTQKKNRGITPRFYFQFEASRFRKPG